MITRLSNEAFPTTEVIYN